ncbi:hypothetical protein [Hymenobacter coccineus]|uniref:Uncharacterized protein n=1 Tax=Hymenobacter coccineus TaxID=1908235 RepID=A0A1G1THK8_9BACT|nr:hypothetical protein [Hymenobacter coccineus]OGX90362.1 hypothetical protein BEN49_23000 [Hymenobacter coccineus]
MTSTALFMFAARFMEFALAVTFLSGVVRFRRLPPELRYLAVFMGLDVLTEISSDWLHRHHQPNLFLFPIFAAMEVWFLALVYDRALQWPAFSRWRPGLAGAFVAYCVLDGWLFPEVARFKPALQIVESVLVLSLVGLYFRKLLRELRVTRLDQEPMFWVSTGIVVNSLGSIQIFLFSNYLLTHYSNQLSTAAWAVHTLLNVVLYACYCTALWIRPRK